MSAAPSLYRRHRPRTFADVVGQEHVVRTLRNAVEQDKLHHAYLFVGSRGTGKTSMAKILAACLNCENGGPTITPCGVCDSCRAIQSASSLDVIEMDAASNNSVDDIRELRDSVQFAPVSGRYKVYILDEAHMLTTQAWNAFLKTLEEPPPSTIFVLATTEASKVLPTVVDRCHRFDFQRPTVGQLSRVVARVAEQEQIDIGPDAVALLARHATGSFRDALGTLEQLVTYSGQSIAVEDVLAVLGVADADLLFGALDAIASHDAPSALRAAARLVGTGRDPSQFVRDLEAHARELLITQTLGEVPAELAVTPDRDARLADQARRVPAADVVRLIDLLALSLRLTKDGADPRTQLELALVKAAAPEVDSGTKALLARLERLERALANVAAAAPPPEPARPAEPAPPTRSAAPPQPTTPAERPASPQAAPAEKQAAPPAPPAPAAPQPAPRAAPVDPELAYYESLAAPEDRPRPTSVTNGTPVVPNVTNVSSPAPSVPAPPVARAAPASAPVTPAPPHIAPAEPIAAAPPAPTVASPTIEELLELWPAVLDTVSEQHSLLATVIGPARPLALDGHELTLAYDHGDAFLRKKADKPEPRQTLTEIIRSVTGFQPRLVFELVDLTALADGLGVPPDELSEAELIDAFKQEFDAREFVPDDEESA